jgi:hypothetical protein
MLIDNGEKVKAAQELMRHANSKREWIESGKDYSVTSVDIAMNVLKVAPSDETRFRIGNYIKGHPELHEVISRGNLLPKISL